MQSKSQKCTILLILSENEEKQSGLHEFLKTTGYSTFHAVTVDEGILKAGTCSPELIICQNKMDGKTALQVYKTLSADLLNHGISFFIYMNEYSKEDVLIGLEIGVDNFVVNPFDKTTLINKIEHRLERIKKYKIIDNEQFNVLFETTPVAKFIAEHDRLIRVNSALKKLTGISENKGQLPTIEEVFNFSEDETTLLNFRKCMNGLKDFYLFKSVPLKSDNQLRFDIQLVFTDYFGKGLFMAEVVKATGVNVNRESAALKPEVEKHQLFETNGINLTNREKEVLDWSAQGLPIKQIATILKISDRTVEKHRANIMAKTKTTSILEAIYAIRRKMEE
jgi:two-component system alkaline phosphatase synthesis response regulator PhoP